MIWSSSSHFSDFFPNLLGLLFFLVFLQLSFICCLDFSPPSSLLRIKYRLPSSNLNLDSLISLTIRTHTSHFQGDRSLKVIGDRSLKVILRRASAPLQIFHRHCSLDDPSHMIDTFVFCARLRCKAEYVVCHG